MCTLADLDYDVYHATIKSSDGIASQEYYVRPRFGCPWDAQRARKLAAMLEASIQRRFPRGLKVHVQSVDSFGCLAALTAVLRDAGLTITRAKAAPRSPLPAPAASPTLISLLPSCDLLQTQNAYLAVWQQLIVSRRCVLHASLLHVLTVPKGWHSQLCELPQVRTNAAHNMCGHTFYVMDANGAAPQRSTVEAACAHVGGHLMEPSSEQAPLSSSGTISFSFMGQQWSSSWGGSAGTALPCCCLLHSRTPQCQHSVTLKTDGLIVCQ